jgi:hypothetical protein
VTALISEHVDDVRSRRQSIERKCLPLFWRSIMRSGIPSVLVTNVELDAGSDAALMQQCGHKIHLSCNRRNSVVSGWKWL